MAALYADTSAIVKRYVSEIGSGWMTAQAFSTVGNVVIISRLTTVEVCSTLARLQRANQIANTDGARLKADFLVHADKEYLTVPLDDAVLVRARDLVSKHPLRTLDAIQLACALEAASGLGESLTFLSADVVLLAAATAEGFTTGNPQSHP